MSRPSKNGGMRGSGEQGDPTDVVVVVGQRAQPRVLVLHNLANTTCQSFVVCHQNTRKVIFTLSTCQSKKKKERQYYEVLTS